MSVSSGDQQTQPFAAGTKIIATCSSGGGKPFPEFRWSFAGEEVEDHAETVGEDGVTASEISVDVDEEHDDALIECWSVTHYFKLNMKYFS